MRRPRLYLFVLALGGAPAYGWQARSDNKVRGPQDGRDGGMCVQARPPAAWSAQGVQQAMWVSEAFYDSPARPSNVDLSGRRHGTRGRVVAVRGRVGERDEPAAGGSGSGVAM